MKNRKIKRLDTVRVLAYAEDSVNGYARVDRVDNERKTVMVSNMNMPFQGTFGMETFGFDEVELPGNR
jgi:hypothetical protein